MNGIQTISAVIPKSGRGKVYIPKEYQDRIVVPEDLEFSREDIIAYPDYHNLIYCGNYLGVKQRLVHIRDRNTDLPRRIHMTWQLAGMLFRELTGLLPTKVIEITTGNGCKMNVDIPDFRVKIINNLRTGTELAIPIRLDACYTTFYSDYGAPKVCFMGMKRPKDFPFHAEMQGYESVDNYEQGEISIICDPIISTAGSVDTSVTRLLELNHPLNTIYVQAIISTPQGVQRIHVKYPEIKMVIAEIDPGADENGYVYPGLGDAGYYFYGIP